MKDTRFVLENIDQLSIFFRIFCLTFLIAMHIYADVNLFLLAPSDCQFFCLTTVVQQWISIQSKTSGWFLTVLNHERSSDLSLWSRLRLIDFSSNIAHTNLPLSFLITNLLLVAKREVWRFILAGTECVKFCIIIFLLIGVSISYMFVDWLRLSFSNEYKVRRSLLAK